MSHISLQTGITGFYRGSNEPPTLPREHVISDCKHVAADRRLPIGRRIWADEAWSVRNFHTIAFGSGDNTAFVLINAHYPVCAFTKEFADRGDPIEFSECTELADAFRRVSRFTPIPLAHLQRRPEAEDLAGLDQVEMEQVSYWKPETIAEIIFNYWD